MTPAGQVVSRLQLSRRKLLRGIGASLALPWLDAMTPAFASRAPQVKAPQRFAWVYIPNGVVQDAWHPTESGRNWEITPSLSPLAPFRSDVNIFTGLDREFRGGTGVHAQAGCCWLTSSPPSEALDGSFPTNRSLDQIIASKIGDETLFRSLELSCNDHDNQKETRYFETVSWYGPGYAANVQKDPREVFDRLFGKQDRSVKSVLDIVGEEARDLSATLGSTDKQKLEEYFESVRSIERRINFALAQNGRRLPPSVARPSTVPNDRGEYIRLMGDLMVLAFQQDLTRVATLVIDPERWDTPRMYDGVWSTPQNHHVLTHTKGEEAKAKLQKIDHFHVQQFAHVVKRLKDIPEHDGTLLDNCLVSLGSGMGDGAVHDYNNVPVVTAGSAGVGLKTGNHYVNVDKVPLANLWATYLDIAGVEQEVFADSTGRISLS